MENAANVRALPAVAAFDATDHLAEYGLRTPDSVALGLARGLVDAVAKDAQRAISDKLHVASSCGNPYRDSVQIGGATVQFALLVDVFPKGTFDERIEKAFGERARPDAAVLQAKIVRELGALIKPFGYELAGIETHHDGSLARVAVRDPIYAAGAAKKRGVELEVTRDIDFATALARVTERERDTGVRWVSSPDLTARIEQHIESAARAAVEIVRNSLRGSVAGGNSPFMPLTDVYMRASVAVVDQDRVENGWKRVSVPRGARIEIGSDEALMSSFNSVFNPQDVTVDRTAFVQHYRETIARHLRANPDLRGALVAPLSKYWNGGSYRSGTVVVCGENVVRPWYKRMFGLGKPQPLALPKPAVEAPKPQIVGPIEMPTR